MRLPVVAFQTCTVRSNPPEAMEVLSGDQATALTILVWPVYVSFQLPVLASQIRTTVRSVPRARDLPSGDQATARTIPRAEECILDHSARYIQHVYTRTASHSERGAIG